ncbi:MAG: hypothetical protein JNJ62_04250 [Pseudoxanthomonas mexicana]|nr:hypothetical protein [Pseudoxanthomonas mexicana]
MRIAINGAGIAGTAFAYWLGKLGHEVLLVERAPQLRTGGFVVNLWGIGYDAVERMGLLPGLLERQHHSDELRMVDAAGRTRGGYPSHVLVKLAKGRMATLARFDIAAAIHGALDDRVDIRFGDTITRIDDRGGAVRIDFEHALSCEVDLVIGADGRTLFFVLLRDEYLRGRIPAEAGERKAMLADALAGVGWEASAILSALGQVDDVYLDSISQIRMDAWTKGRVALIGDAAACPSLIAGEGAGFALAEAYVLAGELHRHAGDTAATFAQYEARLKAVVARKQKQAERLAASFVPRTALGVRVRDYATLLMRLPMFPTLLMGRYFHDEMVLSDYGI